MKTRNLLLALALMSVGTAYGQSRALPILEVNTNVRNTAMGGNYYGEANNMLIYSNPTSLLYGEKKLNVSTTARFFQGEKVSGATGNNILFGASAAYKLGERHGVYVGYRYFGGKKFETFSADGVKGKDYTPMSITLDAGYAFRLNENFSAAVTATFIYDKIARSIDAPAFSIGAAAYYRTELDISDGANLVLGVNAGNMGPKIDYGKKSHKKLLPFYFGGGGELSIKLPEYHSVTFSAGAQEYTLPTKAKMFTANVGAEYTYKEMLSFRAGYNYAEKELSHFAVGAGFAWRNYHLDLAYQKGLAGEKNGAFIIGLGFNL